MATKKDLIEAQNYSRARLLSAFTGGAPGGKELEPAKPLRAVVAGIVLTAMLILGSVFYGLVQPGLPKNWENHRLILANDTGARYISIDGILYPVINTASARLLVPADKFSVITTNQKTLGTTKIGGTIGILGAPDHLPSRAALHNDGWTACSMSESNTSISISKTSPAIVSAEAAVVSVADQIWVIAGTHRYQVDNTNTTAVLRAIGLDAATATGVDGRWLNLFSPGKRLEALTIAGVGQTTKNSNLPIGTVIHRQGSPGDQRFVLTAEGQLSPLSTLAYELYLLGSGANAGADRDVKPSEIAQLQTTKEGAGGKDWPATSLKLMSKTSMPCARLSREGSDTVSALATVPRAQHNPVATSKDATDQEASNTIEVSAHGGALIRVGGSGASGLVYLIDESGTAFSLPDASPNILERLGYTAKDVSRISGDWLAFLPVGPELTEKAAGRSPEAHKR